MPPIASRARSITWLWSFMYLLGAATALLAWVFLALMRGSQSSWMALVTALELVFMLRLGTLKGGRLRVALVVGGTLLVSVLAWWSIASAWLGSSMGLAAWDSALRMGPHLAWTLVGLANTPMDWIWIVVAVAVGAWAAR